MHLARTPMHIQEHISLLQYNSFQIESQARYFVEIHNQSDIQALLQHDIFAQHQNHYLILGGGSNVLFTQSIYD